MIEQANRHAWESHAASTQAMVIDEARTASLAHDAGIRELELAPEVRDGHVAALLLEKEEASRSALARALVWGDQQERAQLQRRSQLLLRRKRKLAARSPDIASLRRRTNYGCVRSQRHIFGC